MARAPSRPDSHDCRPPIRTEYTGCAVRNEEDTTPFMFQQALMSVYASGVPPIVFCRVAPRDGKAQPITTCRRHTHAAFGLAVFVFAEGINRPRSLSFPESSARMLIEL